MDEKLKKAVEWAKKQQKEITLSPPDREPGEEDLTQKQLDYIRHLVPDIDLDFVRSLGKWQASAIIDEIKYQKEKFTEELIDESTQKKSSGCLGIIVLLSTVGMALLVFTLVAFLKT